MLNHMRDTPDMNNSPESDPVRRTVEYLGEGVIGGNPHNYRPIGQGAVAESALEEFDVVIGPGGQPVTKRYLEARGVAAERALIAREKSNDSKVTGE